MRRWTVRCGPAGILSALKVDVPCDFTFKALFARIDLNFVLSHLFVFSLNILNFLIFFLENLMILFFSEITFLTNMRYYPCYQEHLVLEFDDNLILNSSQLSCINFGRPVIRSK